MTKQTVGQSLSSTEHSKVELVMMKSKTSDCNVANERIRFAMSNMLQNQENLIEIAIIVRLKTPIQIFQNCAALFRGISF